MYGSIMRGRLKKGQRDAFQKLMEDRVVVHAPRGLHSIEMAWEDKDPDRVVTIIHFTDKESYVKNARAPETDKDYREMLQYMVGEPEWIDVNYASYAGKPLASEASGR
jgi:quinol monooxygenase YgiN